MLIATFNFHPSRYVYLIKDKSVFQDRSTQDTPNSDRVAVRPYLYQYEGSALTTSWVSVVALAVFAARGVAKRLLGSILKPVALEEFKRKQENNNGESINGKAKRAGINGKGMAGRRIPLGLFRQQV